MSTAHNKRRKIIRQLKGKNKKEGRVYTADWYKEFLNRCKEEPIPNNMLPVLWKPHYPMVIK